MGSVKDTSFILQILSSKNTNTWPIGSYIFWGVDDDDLEEGYASGPGWRSSRDPKEARKFMNKTSALEYWRNNSPIKDVEVRVRKIEVITTITNVE